MTSRPRSWWQTPTVMIVAIGLAIAAAPVAFQMFSRAPQGGRMITDFRPYMSTETIDRFQGHLAEIDAANTEVTQYLPPSARPGQVHAGPALVTLAQDWPTIDQDMTDMLATMRANIGRFRGVSALPPFALFPWFFVLPGAMAAGIGVSVLVSRRRGSSADRRHRVLVAVGLGLIIAPAVFQMFSRAPGGAEMIDEFRPLMSDTRVMTIQGHFLTLGSAEGELRTELLPMVDASSPHPTAATLPDARAFSAHWPAISEQMAPMIGAMADNIGNYAAVDALPPFWLFPWFFVLPGVAIAALALAEARRSSAGAATSAPSPPDSSRQQILEGNRP